MRVYNKPPSTKQWVAVTILAILVIVLIVAKSA